MGWASTARGASASKPGISAPSVATALVRASLFIVKTCAASLPSRLSFLVSRPT